MKANVFKGITLSHFQNDSCIIEYRGTPIFAEKIGKLFKHFEIIWNDNESCWDSEKLGCSGMTILDCVESCIKLANTKDIEFHKETLLDIWNDCENQEEKMEIEDDLKEGNFEAWSRIDFSCKAVELFFKEAEEFIGEPLIFEDDIRSIN